MGNSLVVLHKVKIGSPHDQAILLLGIYWKELKMNSYLYTNVHSSIIYNSQKVEKTQMSANRWMDKQKVLYPYNQILFTYKKE